ncbi:MAG TPA: hypothetical protein VIC60_03275 [Thermomicrobiales bacterium]|jgi:hypothetical protein
MDEMVGGLEHCRAHPGILVFPQPPRLTVGQPDQEIATLLSRQSVMTDMLFVWTTGAGWMRTT